MNHKCPWCESENNFSFLKLKDYFLSQEDFEIYECKDCKLLFTVPCPTPSEIGKYYKSEEYLSHNEEKKGLVPTIYNFVKKINIKNKFKIATDGISSDISLLDIGCGVGDFLLHAKNNSCKITGIEPSEDAREIAEKKLDTQILSPEELQNIPDESFDIITMWHVLEHVANLKEEIYHLQRLLKKNGRLILALPNYKSYDAEYYKDKWAAYDVPRHINHFSEESIRNIFKETNVQLIDIKPLKWDSYYISMLSEKYCKHNLSFVKGVVRGWKSNIKANKTGQYSSLVYIFEKSNDINA
ncbi:MAG: class I SAM-dependent methyltransferase [Bacteroidales bacterium]|nr:class I SAM-dependent methyltransferase [Bacteroidales bacterium]